MIKNLIVILLVLSGCLHSTSSLVLAQNSTKKIRVVPNEISSKIGTAIRWESDFEVAQQKAKESDKPIFWYVPRLANTFMDRKKEVDRYMRAGPFSNPTIIASLNEHYIPLMAIPGKSLAKKYDLEPFKFVEPGFLILGKRGEVDTKLDRITTMNPNWLQTFLIEPSTPPAASETLAKARQRFAAGQYELCKAVDVDSVPANEQVELQLISAMAMFRSNEHQAAFIKFASIGETWPDHPLGWKAAAEAQRIGPFVRGFEVYRELPPEVYLSAGRKSPGSAAPPEAYAESQLWRRGVEFLLTMQNEEGGYEDSDYDFGGTDGLPNVHVAVTSIVGMVLLEAHSRPDLEDLKPRIEKAIEKIAAYVSDEANLNPRDKDEIFWAYLYRLRLFNRLESKWQTGGRGIETSLKSLVGVQTAGGDWYHEYRNPFVTASALWAMKESESLGAPVNASAVEAGIAALKKCRFSGGGWTYGSPRQGSAEKTKANKPRVIGSAGRTPLCEGALVIWDRAEQEALLKSLQDAFEMHDDMDKARKYDDHTSSYSYGGFFYWYCMETRTQAILKVQDETIRRDMAQQQRAIVLSVPEIDGCFVDSHEIGRSYGTAMALLCLADCDKASSEETIR